MKVINGGTKRKYYKWSEPNATIVGSPTIENGVVSGFSLSNYLELPQQFKPNSNTWEIVLKFIDIGNEGWVFSSGYFGESNYVTNVNINFPTGESKVRGCFGFGAGNNYYGLTAPISTTGVQYIKISWNGSQYAIYVSNTSTFSDTPTSYWNSSTAVSQSPIQTRTRIGMLHQGAAGYTGKIDLTESYIKIGGNLWWQGCLIEEADESDYDWYEDVEVKKVVANYSWQDWTQPVLTSDNFETPEGVIVCSASSYFRGNEPSEYNNPYKAMDGNFSYTNTSWASDNATSAWWKVVFPYYLKISAISYLGRYTTTSNIYSDEGQTLIGTVSGSSTTEITVDDVVTNTIYVEVQGTATVGIGEIEITAQYSTQTLYAVRNY